MRLGQVARACRERGVLRLGFRVWVLGFRVWGLRANPAVSDLAPWWVFASGAWGLRATPAESDLSPWWILALGLGPQGGGKTPAPLTRHSRATHIFSAPLTRHSRATPAPLTFALRAVAFLFFHILHLPFCGYSHFPFWGFTVAAVSRKTTQRHSPATRATRAPHHRPCHSPAARAIPSPSAPLTGRRRPAMGWS